MVDVLFEATVTSGERELMSKFYEKLDDLVKEVFSGFNIDKRGGKHPRYYISQGAFEGVELIYELQLNDFVDATVDTVAYFHFPASQINRSIAEYHLSLLIARISLFGNLSASYLFLGSTEAKRETVEDVYSLETLEESDITQMGTMTGIVSESVAPTVVSGYAQERAVIASEKKGSNAWLWLGLIALVVIVFFLVR